jgi:spore coat protein U-like protein
MHVRGHLVLIALVVLPVAPARGGSSSGVLGISATVSNNCTIQTTSLAFGVYDPVGANAADPLDGSAELEIRCTKGASTTIALDPGQHASASAGTTRAMSSSTATAHLSYELYRDAGRTAVWGDAPGAILHAGIAPGAVTRRYAVLGRIPAAQDVPAGTYVDTVVATVNF